MNLIEQNLDWIAAVAIVLASLAAGFLGRTRLLGRLERIVARTSWKGDDALVASLRKPLPLWFLLAGCYLALQFVTVPPRYMPLIEKGLLSVLIASVTLWAADLGSRWIQIGITRRGEGAAPVTGVLRNVVTVTVIAVGGLVLLGTLGISITPVLTTLGIGGLAVALALQDTLANLFAGLHVTMAGNIRVGDYVKLETGDEGYVEDIQWRATRIKTLPNNFVLVPNSRLAQSVVTNFNRPSRDLAVLVAMGVHYGSDLAQVERVVSDVGRAIMRGVPGGVPDFEPFIRYHTFGASSIDFTVILRAREFGDNFLIKHEFVKAVTKAFAQEKIVIPYPIRALNTDQEQATFVRSPA